METQKSPGFLQFSLSPGKFTSSLFKCGLSLLELPSSLLPEIEVVNGSGVEVLLNHFCLVNLLVEAALHSEQLALQLLDVFLPVHFHLLHDLLLGIYISF
jgi:hypothetical protein